MIGLLDMRLHIPMALPVVGALLILGCVDVTPPWEQVSLRRDAGANDGAGAGSDVSVTGADSGGADLRAEAIAPDTGPRDVEEETADAPSGVADGLGDAQVPGPVDGAASPSETGGVPDSGRLEDVGDAAASAPALDGRTDLGDGGQNDSAAGPPGMDGAPDASAGAADVAGADTTTVSDGVGTRGDGGDASAGPDADAAANDGASDAGRDGAGDVAEAGPRSAQWTKIVSGSPQHAYPGVSYDPALQRAVLFGGHTSCAEDAPTNQTWEWDGTSWAKETPTGDIPSPRGSIRMAFDRTDSVAIVHGGWAPTDNPQPGTYAYNLATHAWASLGTSLANLGWYALDYDTDARVVRMFGGNVKTTFYRDVRSWDGNTSTWPGVAPTGPSARARHAWAYDGQHHRFVMFGGFTSWGGSACLTETWEYDPATTTWQQTATSTAHPQTCDTPAMVYDPNRNLTILYGYQNGGETWEYDAGTHLWTNAPGANQPGGTSAASVFYDESRQAVLLVGGCTAGTLQDGTWQYLPAQ
jgi:hypothetical protein